MEDGRKEPMRLTRLGPSHWSLSPWPFAAEELVLRYDGIRLAAHDYRLEPNLSFTPDSKWIVFGSNMHGRNHVYMVEVAKTSSVAV